MANIYDIRDIPESKLSAVGGKARGLFQLIKFGYNVPSAFILTDTDDNTDFDEIVSKYEASGFEEVSVRSSATLEDGTDFSAAGQFATILNVKGSPDVVESVKKCIASLHSYTAEHYSKVFLRSAENRMTVIVQKMVKARCAGVLFSRAPMHPDMVLVEAVPGLGENLVSGKMSAQQYYVRGYIVDSLPSDSILSKEEIVTLADMGKKAESLFGMPMDLEWAIDEDGSIQWLQARPITIGESVTINEFDWKYDASGKVFTTGNIGEVMPGAVTPLTLSTTMYTLDWGVKETYVEIGCADDDFPPFTYITPFYNHMFFNMSSMYLVSRSVLGTSKESMDTSICGMVLEGYPDIDAKKKNIIRRTLNTIPFLKLVFQGEAAKKGMDKTIALFKFDLSQDIKGIYQQILDNFENLKWVNYYHYCASYYSGGQSNILLEMLKKDFQDKSKLQSAFSGCLTQIEDFESANILRMMNNLAEYMIKDCPQVVSYSSTQLMKYIDEEAGDEVRRIYKDFMSRHGHRGIREMELRSSSWNTNRMSFFTSLKSVLVSKNTEISKNEKPWTEYADELLERYKGSKRRYVMNLIMKARKGVCFREYTKSKVVYAIDLYKQAYAKLSQLMTQAGIIPDTDCIYFLTQEEIGKLIDGGDRSLVKRAIARKRIFAQQNSLSFPFASLGIPRPVNTENADGSNLTVFHGTPVSRGKATGRARIVKNENDASHLETGEIMVAVCTDIGWTPYYNVIGGMVTEIGSSLSHGVVVAREYSLPTVVNVADAMRSIHTGDVITIDGDQGMVIINEKVKTK